MDDRKEEIFPNNIIILSLIVKIKTLTLKILDLFVNIVFLIKFKKEKMKIQLIIIFLI